MNGYANLARAAGGAGDVTEFEAAWAKTWVLIDESPTSPLAAGALLDLAWGAASLGEWQRAERAGARALTVAQQRGEHRIVLTAEAALEFIRGRSHVEYRSNTTAEPSSDLADRFIAALQASSGGGADYAGSPAGRR